jgi:phosphoserine phosphatase RsbU/P
MSGDGRPSPEAMALLDSAACGLLQTDATGVIRWSNQVFCNWIGREASEIVGRRRIQDFFTIGGRIFHQTHWVPLIQMQQSVSEVKLDLVHASGHSIPIVLNGIRRVRDGDVVHDLAMFIAGDRDKYERELVATTRRLKEMVERSVELEEIAKDRAHLAEQMMGVVSHDLRNPLAVIELSALALSHGATSPEQQAALQRISRASSRAVRLIHDLLDLTQSRLGNGLTITLREIDLHAVISESVDELRAAFPGRRLRHITDGPGECVGDPDRLMQLVGNLVTNAITYGLADAPITVSSEIHDGAASIVVHNLGKPIDEAMISLLFQPMARGARSPDGSRSIGLGLYIVREIAKAHGGDVVVNSTAADGTSFTAQFPARSLRDAR